MVGSIIWHLFLGNLVLFPAVKGFWKSLNNWQHYHHEFCLLLFWGTQCSFFYIKLQTQRMAQTGGNGVVPVSAAYCLKTSAGCGPSIRNTSMIPLSENQCVSICGISSPFTRSTSLENMFYISITQTNWSSISHSLFMDIYHHYHTWRHWQWHLGC